MKKRSKTWMLRLLALGVVLTACAVRGQGAAAGADVTIITSDRLEFDHKKKYAYFESNVVVTDPDIKITSDELTVNFNEENKVTTIVAKGHVVIEQMGRKAWAGKATYSIEEGKILLVQNPRVMRGKDVLTGDTITFFRDSQKMVCEPRARLIIYPEKGKRSAGSLLKGP